MKKNKNYEFLDSIYNLNIIIITNQDFKNSNK